MVANMLAWICKKKLPISISQLSRFIQGFTYCRLRMTNVVAEGLDRKIMNINRRDWCYRNKEHFKTAIYFYCCGLNLCPC